MHGQLTKDVKSLGELNDQEILHKRVLVRVDFNVPLDGDRITDDTRLRASLPTLEYLRARGAKVIMASHLGRPKGAPDPKYTLRPVASALGKLLGTEVKFAEDCVGPQAEEGAYSLQEGEFLLLENVRFHGEETDNEQEFSRKLASLGELYVNDAFGSAHRAHASTVGVTQHLPTAVAGFLLTKEVRELGSLIEKPERPLVSIIGGSKVSSKLEVLQALIEVSDVLLIGGGMAYTFVKAQGGKIGNSICEDDKLQVANDLLQQAEGRGTALMLPTDSRAVRNLDDRSQAPQVFPIGDIPDGYEACDIGPDSESQFSKLIGESKTGFWNGPVGIFEDERFRQGSQRVAEALVSLHKNGGRTVIGGGDSAAAIAQFGYGDRDVGHISTGGGASLEFISGKVLPGVRALQDR